MRTRSFLNFINSFFFKYIDHLLLLIYDIQNNSKFMHIVYFFIICSISYIYMYLVINFDYQYTLQFSYSVKLKFKLALSQSSNSLK